MPGAQPQLTDATSLQHAGQAGNVIGVKVGDDQQRHLRDPQPVQAAPHRAGFRTAVHHDRAAAAGPHSKPVALTDIAGNHHPVTWRPARLAGRAAQADDHDRGEQQESQGRASTYAIDRPSSSELRPTQARVSGVTEDAIPSPEVANRRGDPNDHLGTPAAPKPKTAASVPLISEAPAAAKPSTVAGPTNGPASAFATRLRR